MGREMQQYIFEIPYTEPEKAFSIFAEDEGSIFLDSSDEKSLHSHFSFIGFSPAETIIARDGKTEIKNREFGLLFPGNPFTVAEERMAVWKNNTILADKLPLPFTNGAAGYFSYDLARHLEKLPKQANDELQVPTMALGLYDQVIGFDLRKKKAYFCALAEDKKSAESKFDILNARLNNFKFHVANTHKPDWQRQKTRAEYKDDVQTVINYIKAGDVFQVNLSQKFTAALPDYFNVYAHYLRLRKINPAPFSAFFKIAGMSLSSSSPERFLNIKNGKIETRPIKGTAPDTENPEHLRLSAKDRAENIMIVDLMRNDLSKICEASSVEVNELCVVESYSGLHHLVSSVAGKLKDNVTSLSALSACFPGGSITGAPKIRAMEIIEGLEPSRRGAYCGSIGYIGFDGTMDCNIAIRTLVFKDNTVTLNVGGGIVAESDPEGEYQETLVKARKVFESFETDKAVFDDLVKKTA